MPLIFCDLSPDLLTVDLEGVLPEKFADASLDQVRRAKCLCGNQEVELGELFRLEGDPRSVDWRFEDDLSRVHSLGVGMSSGTISTSGNVGRRAGARISGGALQVGGNADDWLGAEMTGGRIEVRGDVGRGAGAAFRGGRRGMNRGEILVHGNAGDELGGRMRRGLIAVAGSAGEWVGARMLAGTILVMGDCGPRPGAGMRRGTIGLFGSGPAALLPTFRYACRARLTFLAMLERQLVGRGFDARAGVDQMLVVFHGDFLALGRGEILIGGE